MAFISLRDVVDISAACGGKMGPGCKSPETARAMTLTIDKVKLEDDLDFLTRTETPISIILGEYKANK